MNTKILLGTVLTAAVAASGCSTILRGTYEKVEIVSTPPQALCRIYRDSEGYLKSVDTPGAVYVPRAAEPIRVVCKKDGYKTASVVASPVKTSDIVGNAAGVAAGSGGVMIGGAFIDGIAGANQDLPDVISVNMQRADG
ncbi:MAG: hypothetical protein ACR2QC_08625 [Gammaproteobacteria bacterium]